jgi:hypothetical protein
MSTTELKLKDTVVGKRYTVKMFGGDYLEGTLTSKKKRKDLFDLFDVVFSDVYFLTHGGRSRQIPEFGLGTNSSSLTFIEIAPSAAPAAANAAPVAGAGAGAGAGAAGASGTTGGRRRRRTMHARRRRLTRRK